MKNNLINFDYIQQRKNNELNVIIEEDVERFNRTYQTQLYNTPRINNFKIHHTNEDNDRYNSIHTNFSESFSHDPMILGKLKIKKSYKYSKRLKRIADMSNNYNIVPIDLNIYKKAHKFDSNFKYQFKNLNKEINSMENYIDELNKPYDNDKVHQKVQSIVPEKFYQTSLKKKLNVSLELRDIYSKTMINTREYGIATKKYFLNSPKESERVWINFSNDVNNLEFNKRNSIKNPEKMNREQLKKYLDRILSEKDKKNIKKNIQLKVSKKINSNRLNLEERELMIKKLYDNKMYAQNGMILNYAPNSLLDRMKTDNFYKESFYCDHTIIDMND